MTAASARSESAPYLQIGPIHAYPAQKPFFVRLIEGNRVEYVDIETGLVAEPLDVPFEQAEHGLCAKYGRPVFKKIVDDGFLPLVLIAREQLKPFRHSKPIRVQFTNAEKVKTPWVFSPYELEETSVGLDEGLTPRQIAVRIGAPPDALEMVIERLGGELHGTERNKAKRERAPARDRAARSRKDAS
jgi:hypothetical protein